MPIETTAEINKPRGLVISQSPFTDDTLNTSIRDKMRRALPHREIAVVKGHTADKAMYLGDYGVRVGNTVVPHEFMESEALIQSNLSEGSPLRLASSTIGNDGGYYRYIYGSNIVLGAKRSSGWAVPNDKGPTADEQTFESVDVNGKPCKLLVWQSLNNAISTAYRESGYSTQIYFGHLDLVVCGFNEAGGEVTLFIDENLYKYIEPSDLPTELHNAKLIPVGSDWTEKGALNICLIDRVVIATELPDVIKRYLHVADIEYLELGANSFQQNAGPNCRVAAYDFSNT